MLIGARTFGKGVMQTLTPLPDGAAIKITTAHYLTPNRHDINLTRHRPRYCRSTNLATRALATLPATRSSAPRSRYCKKRSLLKPSLRGAASRPLLCLWRRVRRTIVPLPPKSTSSIRRRIRKIPKPRPRWSGSILPCNLRRAEPRTVILDLDQKLVAVEFAIDGEAGRRRIPLPCSTALLNASPAASRISAISLSEKPQALANPATLLRARATFLISLV